MALSGRDSIEQAELYARAAGQKRMAADAMHLIEAERLKFHMLIFEMARHSE
jgi:hypothetical protein